MFDPIELGREFFERLTEVDAAITAKVAASACSRCGGPWHVGNSPRKPRGGLPVQKSGSDVRFRRPVPTSGSDVRFRSPVPTSGSEVRFRRPVPTSGSDVRFRRPVPTSESEVRVRPPSPTSGSEVRFRRPVPTSGSEVRVRSPCERAGCSHFCGSSCSATPAGVRRFRGSLPDEPDRQRKGEGSCWRAPGPVRHRVESLPGKAGDVPEEEWTVRKKVSSF
jgi:hypothetical protein